MQQPPEKSQGEGKHHVNFGRDRSTSVPGEEGQVGGAGIARWTRSQSERIVTKVSDVDFKEESLAEKAEATTAAAATAATTTTTAAVAAGTSSGASQENQTETLSIVAQTVYDFSKLDVVELYQSKVGNSLIFILMNFYLFQTSHFCTHKMNCSLIYTFSWLSFILENISET